MTWTSHIGRETLVAGPQLSRRFGTPTAKDPMTTLIFGTKTSSTRQNIALLIGRIALGVVLIAHGWQKFFTFGISGVAANFDTMGVPLPAVSATFAAASNWSAASC